MNSQLVIQFIEQGLCFFQIGCIEAFDEPAIDGREEVKCFGPPALFALQPGQHYCRPKLEEPGPLLSGDPQCLVQLALDNLAGVALS